MSATTIKFIPASPSVGLIIGAGAKNLKAIGNQLNADGERVTIYVNNPDGGRLLYTQFCIISKDTQKAEMAYKMLRDIEQDAIDGRINTDTGSRDGGWWNRSLHDITDDSNTTHHVYKHLLIKNQAGLTLGKDSINLVTIQEQYTNVDIVVSNTDTTTTVTYTVPIQHNDDALEAIKALRTIERDTFKQNSQRCYNSSRKSIKKPIDDGCLVTSN